MAPSGATFDEAFERFIDNLFAFALYLGQLGARAENERAMFDRLAPRLLDVARQMEHCAEDRRRMREWVPA